eukprot:9327828-Alexandrium_andersonii.AAC.1
MSASLVGSEMCIRDSPPLWRRPRRVLRAVPIGGGSARRFPAGITWDCPRCLLYTSDAADDM